MVFTNHEKFILFFGSTGFFWIIPSFILFYFFTGLTYHDAVKETGVYNKAVSRLPADIQVARQVCIYLNNTMIKDIQMKGDGDEGKNR